MKSSSSFSILFQRREFISGHNSSDLRELYLYFMDVICSKTKFFFFLEMEIILRDKPIFPLDDLSRLREHLLVKNIP